MATLSLQRSREELKRQGFDTWIVEKPFNQWTKRREDLYNCIDLIGCRKDQQGVIGIQACGEDVSNHISKIMEGSTTPRGNRIEPIKHLVNWLGSGNTFFIWAWRKRGDRGKRKTWELREVEFVLSPTGEVVAQENQVKVEP